MILLFLDILVLLILIAKSIKSCLVKLQLHVAVSNVCQQTGLSHKQEFMQQSKLMPMEIFDRKSFLICFRFYTAMQREIMPGNFFLLLM